VKTAYLFAFASTLVCAMPSAATILIFTSPGAVQPNENILLNGVDTLDSTAIGVTNMSDASVTFLGNENLVTPSNGQARIEAADGGLSQLEFFLTDPLRSFTEVEFNIFGTRATANSVTLNFTDQFGTIFSQISSIGSGQNFFSARAIDDQFITNVSFTLNGNVADVRQFRIGGITMSGGGAGLPVVPEPATWALMILGFGAVGVMSRRNRSASLAA